MDSLMEIPWAEGISSPQDERMMSDKGWYYRKDTDAFCLPDPSPPMVQLGSECRAMVLNRAMRPEEVLEYVELETLSQEVVVGLMGLTIMK